jgi:hypothetical protein
MGKLVDLTGQKFGLLTVLHRSEKKSSAGAIWDCVCECGGTASANTLKLRTGHTTSCGCHRRKVLSNLTHGMSKSGGTYKSWKEMRNRCNNPNAQNYKWYGGRGIKVAPEWDDFMVFLADMGERPKGKTLDRKDSDGDYEKSNCKWSTPKEQAMTNRGCFKPGRNRHDEGAA